MRSILGTLTPPGDGVAAGQRPLIGGPAALEVDLHDTSRRDAAVVIPLTLLVILGVLIGVLRAVIAPLILIATQILSFGPALGLSAVVFEYGFGWRGQDAALRC